MAYIVRKNGRNVIERGFVNQCICGRVITADTIEELQRVTKQHLKSCWSKALASVHSLDG